MSGGIGRGKPVNAVNTGGVGGPIGINAQPGVNHRNLNGGFQRMSMNEGGTPVSMQRQTAGLGGGQHQYQQNSHVGGGSAFNPVPRAQNPRSAFNSNDNSRRMYERQQQNDWGNEATFNNQPTRSMQNQSFHQQQQQEQQDQQHYPNQNSHGNHHGGLQGGHHPAGGRGGRGGGENQYGGGVGGGGERYSDFNNGGSSNYNNNGGFNNSINNGGGGQRFDDEKEGFGGFDNSGGRNNGGYSSNQQQRHQSFPGDEPGYQDAFRNQEMRNKGRRDGFVNDENSGTGRRPNFGSGDTDRIDSCNFCGQIGHWSRDCPNKIQGQEAGGGPPRRQGGIDSRNSYRSNEPGRLAANYTATQTFNNSDRKPPSVYEPAEKSPEQLMEEHINSGVNFDKQDELQVNISGKNSQRPFETFDNSALCPEILANLKALRYEKPSPIQKNAIPNILAQNDIMACAQTGSGKTAAFLLPIISTIVEIKQEEDSAVNHNAPHAIIVTPTRELAKQIVEDGKKYARSTDVKSVAVYGGLSTRFNLKQIGEGCDIIVGTMGRLLHFVNEGSIKFDNLKFFVLDEADRMISEGGFDREISELCMNPSFPKKEDRCTLMFSATFGKKIQILAAQYLQNDYVFISIGKVGAANKDILQTVLEVKQTKKLDKLVEVLTKDVNSYEKDDNERYKKKTLVFVNRKNMADIIGANLSQRAWKSTTMHGDREQHQREEALDLLRSGECAVLVATAVAARGLDVEGIDHVIVFDFPQTIDDYIHRIGRTARIGNPGRATVFYDDEEDHALREELIASLRDAEQIVPNWLDRTTPGATGYEFTGGANAAGGGVVDDDEDWS